MTIISVKFYNFGACILWTKKFAWNLPKYRGFTVIKYAGLPYSSGAFTPTLKHGYGLDRAPYWQGL